MAAVWSCTKDYDAAASSGSSSSEGLYQLTVLVSPNAAAGTVVKSPYRSGYSPGETVTLTPYPASGYSFDSWSGDISGNSVVMDQDQVITAHFSYSGTGSSASSGLSSSSASSVSSAGSSAGIEPADYFDDFNDQNLTALNSWGSWQHEEDGENSVTGSIDLSSSTLKYSYNIGGGTWGYANFYLDFGKTVSFTSEDIATIYFNLKGSGSGEIKLLLMTTEAPAAGNGYGSYKAVIGTAAAGWESKSIDLSTLSWESDGTAATYSLAWALANLTGLKFEVNVPGNSGEIEIDDFYYSSAGGGVSSSSSTESVSSASSSAGSWYYNNLIWSDEFTGSGAPDSGKWQHETMEPGTVNNELQKYTTRTENCYQSGGVLYIKALRDWWNGYEYTSARIKTQDRFSFTCGRVAVRAKVAAGRGSWPAIWMLGTDIYTTGWPGCGEIDIMEYVGYDPGVVHGSAHAPNYYFANGTQQTATVNVSDAETVWHVYTIEWFDDHIDYYVDNTKYLTVIPEGGDKYDDNAWPFDSDQFILLNVAVGGDWGGINGIDNSAFPMTMQVDYVRVYQ